MALNVDSYLGEKGQYLQKEERDYCNDMSAILLIDGIAVVDEEKAKKLVLFLLKKIQPFGSVIKNDVFIPINPETKLSYGAAVLEMKNAEEAKRVIAGLDNTPMDKSHTFHVYKYKDVLETVGNSKDFVIPSKEDYSSIAKASQEFGDLYDWMKDSLQRDQYVIRYQNETEVYWCESPKPEMVYNGASYKEQKKVWCNGDVCWSPLGSYIMTYHPQGLIIWGGNKFTERGRFLHNGVKAADFSSKENYLVTWNGMTGLSNKDAICIWDVRTNQCLRKFPCSETVWPSFKFSADEKFLAFQSANGIGICSIPSMVVLKKSCMGVSEISAYAWSPSGSILAYSIPEQGSKPATVVLLDVATDIRVQSASFTNVEEMSMKWSPNGNALAIIVARYPKKKGKNLTCQISIIRVNEKNSPIDPLPVAEKIIDFAWEPTGIHFALLTEDKEKRRNVSFYNMMTRKGSETINAVSLYYTVTSKECNQLHWSPSGNYIIFAGLGSALKGKLEFWDMATQSTLAKQDHFTCTCISWCPSGYYVVTSSCMDKKSKQDYENGYIIWNNRGEKVFDSHLPAFSSFAFRPWPLATLTEEMKREVKKNLPESIIKYKALNESIEAMKHIDIIKQKLQMLDAFVARRKEMMKHKEELDMKRKELYSTNDQYTIIVEYEEGEVIEETETVV